MNYISITIYVFIAVGVIAVIIALIYTKLIKKTKWAYTAFNWTEIKKIIDQFNQIDSNSRFLYKVILKNEQRRTLNSYYLLICVNKYGIFFVAPPLEAKIEAMQYQGVKTTLKLSQGVIKLIPPEIDLFLKSYKGIKAYINKKIPMNFYFLILYKNKMKKFNYDRANEHLLHLNFTDFNPLITNLTKTYNLDLISQTFETLYQDAIFLASKNFLVNYWIKKRRN